jgi:hypothetical protein
MLKRILLIACIGMMLSSCFFSRKSSSSSKSSRSLSGHTSVPKSTDDGLSYETAIVITETSETKGVAAEYAWLREHYPGAKMNQQSLTTHDGKPYDILNIKTEQGKELDIYFDISNFFGKF